MAARATRLVGASLGCVAIAAALTLACRQTSAPAPANRTPGADSSRPAPARAQRVVSLVPAVTEMLFAVGAGAQVVGVGSFDAFPPEIATLPRVGALVDPNIERILSLHPDLVVSYASQSDLQAQLARASIPVFNYRHAGLESVFETLAGIGAAVGHEHEAAQLAADIRARLDAVRERITGRQHPSTLLVFERDPGSLRGIYVSGGVGFLHEMLELAGGHNVFADVARESVQPSHETLLSRAPDVILEIRAAGLIDSADRIDQERAAWASLASVPAVRNGRIHFLTGDYFVVPGPRLAMAVEAMARAIHPEAGW